MSLRLLTLLTLITMAIAAPVAAQADDVPQATPTYQVCEWGLLTIEHDTNPGPIFVTITDPANYSATTGDSVTVGGRGAGLFEGNIVVEATTPDGEIVFMEPTILNAEEIGGEGDWSLEVDLSSVEANTPVMITAYSTSPEDGAVITSDSIRLNAKSDFGLPFVSIEQPIGGENVGNGTLTISGTAGSAFENNIVIEVRDFATNDILAETFATIDTDELAGRGPWTAEVELDVEPGTGVIISAFHPPVADGETISVVDTRYVTVSALAQSYERVLVISADDPMNATDDLCSLAEAEFDNENVQPLAVEAVSVISTRSMPPMVTVNIDAGGSSNCAMPVRTRAVREGDAYTIDFYYDTTDPVICTADYVSITQQVALGVVDAPDFSVTVNGVSAE